MKIIDMRFRPPFGTILNGMLYNNMEAKIKTAESRGTTISQAAREKSMELTLQEMDQYHVAYGVVTVRKTNFGKNEELLDLLAQYPDRFIGIPHIDPLEGDFALEEIEKYVLKGPCKGIIVEGGHKFNKEHWYLDDPRADFVFEKCQKEGIPVLSTTGGRLVKDQSYHNPLYVDRMASKFPDLRIVACHGSWPFVREICHVAVERPNVYISPDVFMLDFVPGHQDYVLAANFMLRNRILFGTAFPSTSLKDGVERYTKLLRPEVLDLVMYQNAARLFNL